MNFLRLFVLALFFLSSGAAQINRIADFSSHFKKHGVDGCFVLYDEAANTYTRYNPTVCDSAFLPASTFKIPNSLIALEEGVIKDTLQVVKWDSIVSLVKTWNQDQTMATAVRYSCVWFFVKVADQVGSSAYKHYLELFDYGNKQIGKPANRFWLEGNLRISANQQIDFLRKFYEHRLPVSRRSVDIVKNLIVLDLGKGYTFSAKTGGTNVDDKHFIMWLVGYVERGMNVYYYALNFLSDDFDKTKQARLDITKAILKDMKLTD